jgi:predicted lipid carrier protein YhbT
VRRAATASVAADVRAKLADLRRRYDPDGLFG